MKVQTAIQTFAVAILVVAAGMLTQPASSAEELRYLSPSVLAVSKCGGEVYVLESGVNRLAVLNTEDGTVKATIKLPGQPTGIAVSQACATDLYVTCANPEGIVCRVDLKKGKVVRKIKAGWGACGPVLNPDETLLYVCNRYEDEVVTINLKRRKTIERVAVSRQPIGAALTPDGKYLLVANHLPEGRADRDYVSAAVTVIETSRSRVVNNIVLPNGSTSVKAVTVSPDGRYAYVTHILGRYQMPTTQLERGWMNTNALSVIDIEKRNLLNTVLLDDVDRGAANPWGVACSEDGETVYVTHAGTHELSVIDMPALLEKLQGLPEEADPYRTPQYTAASISAKDVPNDLSFLVGVRKRVPLKEKGPRGVAVHGTTVYTANYFAGSLCKVDLSDRERPKVTPISLGEEEEISIERKGELLFHDADICFQGWQSCTSCHPDSRTDALNWDLLNDGIGNPKNSKSMLLAHETPPAMSLGIRADAQTAVRAGIKHILFIVRPEEDAEAIDAYLKSLKPAPSPYLNRGKLSREAKQGKKLFLDNEVGCGNCHSGPLYTDLEMYDVGTRGRFDRNDVFDTPALIEVWRSGPYLHDGGAATIEDVLTTRNTEDRHGKTSHLSDDELADLAEFVLSL